MAQRTKANLRGFLIPYPFTKNDILTGSPNTDFTTYLPIADVPTSSDETKLFVGATGSTTASVDLQILTSRAGSASTAQYRVRDNSYSTTIDYGCDQATLITDWKLLRGEQATIRCFQSDIIRDNDGGYIVVYEEKNTSSNTLFIKCKEVDAQNNVTTSTIANIGVSVGLFGSQGKPSLVRMNDDSLLCFIAQEEDEYVNFNTYRSTDNGNNWAIVAKQVLEEEINVNSSNYDIERVSSVYAHGQILMVISAASNSSSHTKKNQLLQYASVDGGATFQKVTTEASLDTNSFKSVHATKIDNQHAVFYVAATDEIHFVKLPHAFFQIQSLRTAGKYIKVNAGGSANDFAAGSDNNMTSGWVSGVQRPEGDIYVYALDVSDSSVVAMYSADSRNFTSLLTNASPTTQPSVFYGDNTDAIQYFNTCDFQGGVAMSHGWTGSTNGDSIAVIYLGGFTTAPQTFRSFYYTANIPIYRGQSSFNYLPFHTAASSSELSSSGTGTETLGEGHLQLQVTSSQTDILFERHRTSVVSGKGITVRGVLTVVSTATGGGVLTHAPAVCTIELEQSTGNYWKLKLEMLTSSFTVTDITSTPNTLLNQSFNCDQGFEYIMTINASGKAAFYYRNSGQDSLKTMIEGFKNTSLSTSPTGVSNDTKVIFGIEGSPSSGTSETRWEQLVCIDQTGFADISNLLNSDKIGLRFSATQYQYVDSGVSIIAKSGPTYIGDDWNIKATSHSSIDNLFYSISPSPRVTWKSATVSTGADVPTQRFALELSTNSSDLGNDIIALHLNNINFRDVELQYWNGAIWVNVFAFETSSGMKHGYSRQGRTIKQDSGNLHDRSYYFYNELKDYIAMCVSGENTSFFRVQSNTEGIFGDGASKLCIVTLDGEPSFDGTVYFIPTNVTVVCSLNGIDSNRWAIRLPAQPTVDDQFRIGHFFLGSVAITGTQYSKGRRITIDSGNIVNITSDKTRYSRHVAPEQRSVQLAWSDGVDQSSFYDNNPDPDYFKSSSSGGSQPVSVYQDAPYMMEGILRGLKGSHTPLVYLPSITTTTDNRVYNRRAEHLCAVIDSEITMTSITGEELIGNGEGEVMRVGTITILEIV